MSTALWLEAMPLGEAGPPRRGAGAPLRRARCSCGARREEELEAVGLVPEGVFVRLRIAAGTRDANQLANAVFWRRHPELDGVKIQPGQRDLANEWLAILRDVVKPALASTSGTVVAPAAPASGDVAGALKMSARQVPGLNITLRALVERHRAAVAPELPIEVLLAFIYREAGHHTFDDATAGKWNEKTQRYVPGFYELGLFQTPAGEHGCSQRDGKKTCAHAPPGVGVEKSSFGKGWLRIAGRLPDARTWKDPELQVRVGLHDLTSVGERIRSEYPDLFPSKSSEWYVRMAVLYSFARGAGWTRAFLSTFRAQLAKLPEAQRWDFLRDKVAVAKLLSGPARSGFSPGNVDDKMSLAAKLRSGPAPTPSPAPRPPATPPVPVVPASGAGVIYDGQTPAPGTAETRRSYPTEPPVLSAPGRRSAALYDNVINQFAAGVNPRYAHRNGSTFCNIFAWDVTRAMGAEIPHWVDRSGNPTPHLKGNELNANAVNTWLHQHGARFGWSKVPLADGVAHANQGRPVVASWKNGGGIGHIAVIRPGVSTEAEGPWMAQAGAKNSNRIRMYAVWKKSTPVEIWSHE